MNNNIETNKRNDANMYDVSTYTDKELYNILDLDSPTDRELEAKIIFLINKYKNIQNASGDQLAEFFENIYKRFFELEEDELSENDEDNEEIEEGFENMKTKISNQEIKKNEQMQPINIKNVPNVMNVKQLDEKNADEIGYTKALEYTNDKLNPLLQQTVKRVISIDSQYRDDKTTLSTEFTFNLSDPLKDVVSLKLYSVQIPYTWYTINNNFGSNFFVLKGNVDGIDNGNHDYQIDISAGNYSPQELTDTINESIVSVQDVYTDVSFGNTNLSYNRFNSLITTNIDIYKQYNETSYELRFPSWSSPEVEDADRLTTIPSFLGFTNDEYKLFHIESTRTVPISTDTANESIRFYIDSTNNYFTINKYIGDIYNNGIGVNLDKIITITLSLQSGNSYTRRQIYTNLNEVIQANTYLSSESEIVRTDISEINNSYFTLKLKPNKNTTNSISGSKMQIQFPDESLTETNLRLVWTGTNSCFQFNADANRIIEVNNVISEVSPLQQELTLFEVFSNPYIYLSCIKPGYDVSTNNYKIEVSNTTQLPYNLSRYVSAINDGLLTTENSSNFVLDNTYVQVDLQNRLNVQFDLTQNINRTSFKIDLTGGFLNQIMNFDTSYNLDIAGTFTSSFAYNTTYNIPTSGIMAKISALTPGETIGADLSFVLNHPPNTNTNNNSTPYATGLINTLENTINQSFTDFKDPDNINILSGTNMRLIKRANENIVDATLNIVINKQLTEADYNIQFLEDTSFNLTTTDFKLDLSGGLSTDIGKYVRYTEDNQNNLSYDITETVINNIGFLNTFLGLSGDPNDDGWYDLSNGSVFTSYITASSPYIIDSSYIAYIQVKPLDIPFYGKTSSTLYNSTEPHGYLIPAPTNRAFVTIEELASSLTAQFTNIPDLYGTKIELSRREPDDGGIDCKFTVVINQNYNQDTWFKNFNIDRVMIDTSFKLENSQQQYNHLDEPTTYSDLSYSTTNLSGSIALGVKGYKGISQNIFRCDTTNNTFELIPYDDGVFTNTNSNNLLFTLPIEVNGLRIDYTRRTLLERMNNLFVGTIAEGSTISIITDEEGIEYTKIRITVNKEYTSKDYRIVFYDPYSFVKCFSGVNSVRNVTWDTTLGWILGFRESTIYYLSDYTTARSASILADTGISTNLFNYFLITLDDYNQNHLNDGLVTITTKETEIPLPSYANRTNYICDPITKELTYNTTLRTDYSKLTQNQIYSLTQIANSKNAANQVSEGEVSAKNYGSGPFAKDVFGIIPMKLSGLKNGDSFVEYGGTLQNQERVYFGPVNIQRMTVKLLGDRGNVVDLNGANWSFSLICEQLYRPQINSKK